MLPRGQAGQTKALGPAFRSAGNSSSVTVGNTVSATFSGALPAGTNVIGHVVVDSGTVTANPTGSTPVLANALSTTVKSVVSSVTATLDSLTILNPNATLAYIQIFDVATAGAVSLGTTVPKWSLGLEQATSVNLTNLNLHFVNGIQVAATTTATGSTALVTAVDANFGYH